MAAVLRLQHISIPMPAGGNDQAREFFGKKLGLEEKPTPASLDGDRIVWFRLGKGGDELHLFTEEGEPKSPGQHLCLQVDDLDQWRKNLSANRVEVEETIPITNRPRFMIRDPFGNRIEITQVVGNYTEPAANDARRP